MGGERHGQTGSAMRSASSTSDASRQVDVMAVRQRWSIGDDKADTQPLTSWKGTQIEASYPCPTFEFSPAPAASGMCPQSRIAILTALTMGSLRKPRQCLKTSHTVNRRAQAPDYRRRAAG